MKINYKSFIYLALSLSWITGVTFFILNRWFRLEGEFGEEIRPWQFTVLKVHGAAAFVMISFFGYMLANHISIFWKKRKQRVAGMWLLVIHATLILSAYILYYTSSDLLREYTSYTHTFIGLVYPVVLYLHIKEFRKEKVRAKNKM